jgi:hypothetical protein
VIRADDRDSLERLRTRVAAITSTAPFPDERDHALLETYLPGAEVALEGMLTDGQLEVLALFDKPEPLTGPYFEESYYVTPSRHPEAVQERVAERVSQACAAYGSGFRRPAPHTVCAMARCTPRCACMTAMPGCWSSPRAPSVASAHGC